MASIKWGMVCSIPDPDCKEKMKEFGHWMVENLVSNTRKLRLHLNFSKEPSFVRHCEPGNREHLFDTYNLISVQHGDVLYVLHVFPHKNSCEFKWVRSELSSRYVLIVQGVLLERVVDRFASLSADSGGDLRAVFDSMSQWMQRRLSQLVCFKRPENTYKLIIVHSQKPKGDAAVETLNSNAEGGEEEEGDGKDECRVKVSGFPLHYNDLQLVSLFCDGFQPLRVELTSSEDGNGSSQAIIEFKNRFHAIQVIMLYHGNSFESFGGEPVEDFTLHVASCSSTVQEKAHALWDRLRRKKRNELEDGESSLRCYCCFHSLSQSPLF